MCGVPVHAADDYLQKLISLGFRVAVCEQLEDPAEAKKRGGKAVVHRGSGPRWSRPATLTEDSAAGRARRNNFVLTLARGAHRIAKGRGELRPRRGSNMSSGAVDSASPAAVRGIWARALAALPTRREDASSPTGCILDDDGAAPTAR